MEKAEDLQKQIKDIAGMIDRFREKGQDPSPVVSVQDMLRGRFAFLREDLDSSKSFYAEAIAGFQKLEMDDMRATVAIEAAERFFEKNDPRTGMNFCQAAIDSVDNIWWKTSLPDRIKVPEIAVKTYDRGVKIAYTQQKFDLVFEYIQRAKSRWLLDVLMLKHIDQSVPYIEFLVKKVKWDELLKSSRQDLHDALSRLDERWNSYIESRVSEAVLQGAEEQVWKAYRQLSKFVFGPVKTRAHTSGIHEIQSKLATNEALIELFVQTDGIYTILIKHEQAKFFCYKISANDLKYCVNTTYFSLIQGESRRRFKKKIEDIMEKESDVMEKLANIPYRAPDENLQIGYDILIKPLEKFLSDVQRIIICPHWGLHMIPFGALFSSAKKDDDFIIKSKSITYCPSASIWKRLKDIGEERKSPKKANNYAVVGVEKTFDSGWSKKINKFIEKLIGSAKISDFEAEAIDIARKLKTTPILGDSATKDAVIKKLSTNDMIHLSCHSALNRPHPLLNGLLLSDGILSLAEILTNDNLSSANPSLISLSACRSGLDVIEPGDIFCGSGYGFLARMGCPVLSSLWPVDTEATRLLMGKFYEYSKNTEDYAEALQRAQCVTMESFSNPDKNGNIISFADPYYWAGFVLLGA